MKYIRTKDGIYRYDETNEKDYLNYCSSATSDIIEELCDEIVYKNYFFNQDEPMLYPKEWDYKTLLKREPNVIVYGAIWTDKGLIYVARVNDKGELELL